jgi:ADP-ribosylglycohydrolase
VDTADVVEALLHWAQDEEMLRRFAGPTTRVALVRLKAGEDPATVGRGSVHNGTGTTNGAAMKIAPAGWMNPGSIEGAVASAVAVALPTHNTQIAIAGAAAIAAGCAEAVREAATVDTVVQACIRGAELGEQEGLRTGREAPGPSVPQRIRFAVDIAESAPTLEAAVERIGALVGSGLAAAEAVPAAVGLFRAADGDVRATATACANVGDDTDTVGCMATALAGSLRGRAGIPQDWYELITTVNELELDQLAKRLAAAASLTATS